MAQAVSKRMAQYKKSTGLNENAKDLGDPFHGRRPLEKYVHVQTTD